MSSRSPISPGAQRPSPAGGGTPGHPLSALTSSPEVPLQPWGSMWVLGLRGGCQDRGQETDGHAAGHSPLQDRVPPEPAFWHLRVVLETGCGAEGGPGAAPRPRPASGPAPGGERVRGRRERDAEGQGPRWRGCGCREHHGGRAWAQRGADRWDPMGSGAGARGAALAAGVQPVRPGPHCRARLSPPPPRPPC